MKTIVQSVEPQPILADPKPPGRWIWSATENPILDICKDRNARGMSWWNTTNELDEMEKYCPIPRPKGSKVAFVFDGARWNWAVSIKTPKGARVEQTEATEAARTTKRCAAFADASRVQVEKYLRLLGEVCARPTPKSARDLQTVLVEIASITRLLEWHRARAED